MSSKVKSSPAAKLMSKKLHQAKSFKIPSLKKSDSNNKFPPRSPNPAPAPIISEHIGELTRGISSVSQHSSASNSNNSNSGSNSINNTTASLTPSPIPEAEEATFTTTPQHSNKTWAKAVVALPADFAPPLTGAESIKNPFDDDDDDDDDDEDGDANNNNNNNNKIETAKQNGLDQEIKMHMDRHQQSSMGDEDSTEDSIMGMSTELVDEDADADGGADGAAHRRDRNDSIDSWDQEDMIIKHHNSQGNNELDVSYTNSMEGCSIESDDDYYRQDYFTGLSNHIQGTGDDGGDDDQDGGLLSKSEHDIYNHIDDVDDDDDNPGIDKSGSTDRSDIMAGSYSEQYLGDDAESGTGSLGIGSSLSKNILERMVNGSGSPHHNNIPSDEVNVRPSSQLDDISEVGSSHADFRVDASNPLDLAAPAKRDYSAYFGKMLEMDSGEEDEVDENGIMPLVQTDDSFHEEYDVKGTMTKAERDEKKKKKEEERRGRSSLQKSPDKENNEGQVSKPTSAQDPSNTTGHVGLASGNADFAAALKQASTKLHHDQDNKGEEENDNGDKKINSKSNFASALKQVQLRSSSPLETINPSNPLETIKPEETAKKREMVKRQSNSTLSTGSEGDMMMVKTPNSRREMLDNIERIANQPLTPDDGTPSPGKHAGTRSAAKAHTNAPPPPYYVEEMAKMAKENRKLRKRRKELLALLGSTAAQFSSYERVCSKKISQLEEKNKVLRNPEKNEDLELALSLSGTLSAEGGGVNNNNGSTSPRSSSSGGENSRGNSSEKHHKKYDAEIVRRLSNGVLMQEKQLKAKDEHATALKLRCEVLKQSLMDKDNEILEEKKLWEKEREKLLKKSVGSCDNSSSSSPAKENHNYHGELLTKRMEVTRLKKELETALNDITMLTTALETNNEALDATVVELDKIKKWKAQYGEAAASLVAPPVTSLWTTDSEHLRGEMKDKDAEITALQSDLESSLNEIEELRADIKFAAKARGYDDFQNVVENLKTVSKISKEEKDIADEKIAKLEGELKRKNVEIDQLRGGKSLNGVSANIFQAITGGSSHGSTHGSTRSIDESRPLDDQQTALPNSRRRLFGRLIGAKDPPDEATDFPTMVRQRDLKIKSLEAMIHSNSRIIEKMKHDIERMDTEKEEVEYTTQQRIEKLEEDNKIFEMQVEGYENTFRNLNEQRVEDIVDQNMFMWDEKDIDNTRVSGNGESNDDAVDELQSKNSQLQRMITELQSSGSFQEDQIETLKAELIKLRVRSQQEKEVELAQLREENKIITAQRSALESQLVDINKNAGVYRNSLSVSPTAADRNDGVAGSDPILVTQVAMLENANKVLQSSVSTLRDDMQEKLAPMLAQIALLEEEKRMVEEEMETKLSCREMTITSLEESLQQLHKMSRKMGGGSKPSTPSSSPGRSAIKQKR